MPTTAPRWPFVAAFALAVTLVVGVVVAAVVVRSSTDDVGPLPLAPVPAPLADSPECGQLLAALPAELTSGEQRLVRRRLADPAPPGTAAWGADPVVVLRCGLERPAELTNTSTFVDVSGVPWLQLPGAGASTWVTVDRPVYVALTLPDGSGSGPLQDVSATVRATLRPGAPDI